MQESKHMKDAEIVLGDFFEKAKNIPGGSADLVIIDGPYYRIKGGFDFVFKSFQEWQDFYRKTAEEVKRIISPTGTIIVWGHALRIAYQQVIFDEHFNLLNNAVWEKIDCLAKKAEWSQDRRLKPITERFLVYSAERDYSYRDYSYNKEFESLRLYVKGCMDAVKKHTNYSSNDKVAEIVGLTGEMVRHWTTTSQWQFISKLRYEAFQEVFPEYFPKAYAPLRKEYLEIMDRVNGDREKAEKLALFKRVRRFFDNTRYYLFDSIRHHQQINVTKKYKHPTQKPLNLSQKLIETMTQEKDFVVVPFGGSGTEVEAALKGGRKIWACEKDPVHYRTIVDRANKILKAPTLFCEKDPTHHQKIVDRANKILKAPTLF